MNELLFMSPLGTMKLSGTESAIFSLEWTHKNFSTSKTNIKKRSPINSNSLLRGAHIQLQEYFQGRRIRFDLPLAPQGTEFQIQVWNALQKIPFGHTWSYGKEAECLGNPKAARAVGSANGKNPIPIIIPCHRVISSNGSLGGFSAGIDRKKWLLRHEAIELGP